MKHPSDPQYDGDQTVREPTIHEAVLKAQIEVRENIAALAVKFAESQAATIRRLESENADLLSGLKVMTAARDSAVGEEIALRAEVGRLKAVHQTIVDSHDMASELFTSDKDMADNLAAHSRAALTATPAAQPVRGNGDTKLVKAQADYIAFLKREWDKVALFLQVHGQHCLPSVYEEGVRLRAAIDAAIAQCDAARKDNTL